MKNLRYYKILLSLLSFQIILQEIGGQIRRPSQPGIIQVCGFRNSGPDPTHSSFNRIVGGQPARKNEFKWQISMRFKRGSDLHHICGGTIIGQSWIVTAAHCTRGFRMNRIVFVAGDHRIDAPEITEQHRTADKIIAHENYKSTTQENDIALVHLESPWDFTTGVVAPACLPTPEEDFTGISCVVTGWGRDKEEGKSASLLQKVWVPIIADKQCKTSMDNLGYKGLVKNTMVCAGYDEGGKDACQGDSGGPLVCPGKGRLPVLIGVVSWGIGCARKGIPGIYTEVAHYEEWINRKIIENQSNRVNIWPFLDHSSNLQQEFQSNVGQNKVFVSPSNDLSITKIQEKFKPVVHQTYFSSVSDESGESSEEKH